MVRCMGMKLLKSKSDYKANSILPRVLLSPNKLEARCGDWKVDNRMRKYYKLTEAGTKTVNRLAELEDFIRTMQFSESQT
jgi:hypothetical protein